MAANGASALAQTLELRPDVVFLDIRMPGQSGLEVAECLAEDWVEGALPLIVFVTAYDHFALQAFEVQAVDYLLKPFNRARFATALARAKATVRLQDRATVSRRLDDILDSLGRLIRTVLKQRRSIGNGYWETG